MHAKFSIKGSEPGFNNFLIFQTNAFSHLFKIIYISMAWLYKLLYIY